MTNGQILEKAIEKATSNGFNKQHSLMSVYYVCRTRKSLFKSNQYYRIIFSRDFAKAFFGEWLMDNRIEIWKFHLQQMVFEPEPLKYLKKFL